MHALNDSNETECVSHSFIREMVDSGQIAEKSEDMYFNELVTVLNTLNANGTADTFDEVLNYELIKGRSLKQLLNFLKGKDSQKKVLTKLLISICNTEQKSRLLNLVVPVKDDCLTIEFSAMLSIWEITPYEILESKEFNIGRKARAEITKALVF